MDALTVGFEVVTLAATAVSVITLVGFVVWDSIVDARATAARRQMTALPNLPKLSRAALVARRRSRSARQVTEAKAA